MKDTKKSIYLINEDYVPNDCVNTTPDACMNLSESSESSSLFLFPLPFFVFLGAIADNVAA